MGTWGTAIFSDDLACDIREDYRDLLGDGHSSQEATATLLHEYAHSLHDQDEEPVFWLALAATQWKCGRLEERVKEQALRIIEERTDLPRWQETPKELRKRQAALAKLRLQLQLPQPLPKKIPKRFVSTCAWEVGELITYRLLSNRFIIFRVIGYHTDKGGTSPVVHMLKWVGEKIPTAHELAHMEFWADPHDYRPKYIAVFDKNGIYSHLAPNSEIQHQILLSIILLQGKETDMPAARIQRLEYKLCPTEVYDGGGSCLHWRYMDRQLEGTFGYS